MRVLLIIVGLASLARIRIVDRLDICPPDPPTRPALIPPSLARAVELDSSNPWSALDPLPVIPVSVRAGLPCPPWQVAAEDSTDLGTRCLPDVTAGGGVIQAVGTAPSRGSRRSSFGAGGTGRGCRHSGGSWCIRPRLVARRGSGRRCWSAQAGDQALESEPPQRHSYVGGRWAGRPRWCPDQASSALPPLLHEEPVYMTAGGA